MRSPAGGFTLLEVVIVIAIIMILGGVSILSYSAFAARGTALQDEIDATAADADDEIATLTSSVPVTDAMLPPPPLRIDIGLSTAVIQTSNHVVGNPVEVLVTVLDTAGEPVVGAEVLLAVNGANSDARDEGVADANGEVTLGYQGMEPGTDVILLCSGWYGASVDECVLDDEHQAVDVVTPSVSWEPFEPLNAQRHTIPSDVVVTWSDAPVPGGANSAYRVYTNSSCTADELGGVSRHPSPDANTVRIRMADEWLEENRWLRVLPNAEQNAGGATNGLSDCMPID